MKRIEIYTDGACRGNPGPGGWGALLKFDNHEKEISGGENNTTNNRMELMAAIKALETVKEICEIDLYTDSDEISVGHRTLFIDIEVDISTGYPTPEEAQNPITSIAIYDQAGNQRTVFILDPDGTVKDRDESSYRIFAFKNKNIYLKNKLVNFITKK